MNKAIELKKGIFRLGANDRRTHRFENYWPIPKGVAYNSYIVKAEKTALIDTIERSFFDSYIEQVKNIATNGIDYLVINHMEPDHTGSINAIIALYPNITIVGNAKTFPMLKNFYGSYSNVLEVKDGQCVDLGGKSLTFYMTPMLHWPETMVTYVKEDEVLFSGDIFGSFGCVDGGVFDDTIDLAYLEDEMSRYYANIVAKYGIPAQTALKKLGALKLSIIGSTHGPVWRSHINDIIAKYDKWSKYEAEKGVVIAYSSIYGHTADMADHIAASLSEYGIKNIHIYDTTTTHPSYILNDIMRFKAVIFGSCAYNTGIFPTMETLLSELENIGIKNRVFAYFANKSWAGGAVKRFEKFAEAVHWTPVAPCCEAMGNPTDADLNQCDVIAKAVVDALN